jgi:hypothetical protein
MEGVRQLLDVLQVQERCRFRDLIAGDERLVYLNMNPGTIWLPADAELSVRVKRTIVSDKRMLIIFWGIHGIAHYGWISKENTLDSSFFVKKCLVHSLRKCSPIPKNGHPLDFDL